MVFPPKGKKRLLVRMSHVLSLFLNAPDCAKRRCRAKRWSRKTTRCGGCFETPETFSGGVCRDVVEKHVLPRLNSNDVKFLYGVNTETRKLIKRSSRKGELKKRFKVREMSSVSTLEFAWENKSLWPRSWDETWFLLASCSNE